MGKQVFKVRKKGDVIKFAKTHDIGQNTFFFYRYSMHLSINRFTGKV